MSSSAVARQTRVDAIMLVALLAHLPLGVLMHSSPALATAHGIITLLVAVTLAVAHPRLQYAVYAAAYVVGADVVWRMNLASLPWELSKYACILILLIVGARVRGVRGDRLGLAYFALLLPSILVLEPSTLRHLRSDLSFNLSGPLCLAVCVWFFSRVSLTASEHRMLRWVLLAPILAVAAVVVTVRAQAEVHYGSASVAESSGGYGPNQVSSMLGLGVVLTFYTALDEFHPRVVRIGAGAASLLLAMQSALTFSRGGLYGAAAALGLGLLAQARRPRDMLRWLTLAAALAVVAELFVVPQLMEQTEGAIADRFADTTTTGRASMARQEFQVFVENPLLGVGPGGGAKYRVEGKRIAAHTEYSRTLAEHGLLGAISLLILLHLAVKNVRQAGPGMHRSIAICSIVWTATFMMHAGMRLAAPAFLFGLAAAGFLREPRAVRAPRSEPATAPAASSAA